MIRIKDKFRVAGESARARAEIAASLPKEETMRRSLLTLTSHRDPNDAASARLIAGTLFCALLWLAASASQAAVIAFEVRYTLNYYPPNPCAGTSVGSYPLEGSTLGGLLSVFYRDADGNPVSLGSAALDGLACGSRLDGVLDFSLDSSALPSSLLASFGGSIHIPNPGPPDLPLFAFAEGADPQAAPSPGPPDLPLAALNRDGSIVVPNSGPPELPLFAFASPGTRVGTLTMAVSRVPEPATLLLGLAGLAGLWASRRSRTAGAH